MSDDESQPRLTRSDSSPAVCSSPKKGQSLSDYLESSKHFLLFDSSSQPEGQGSPIPSATKSNPEFETGAESPTTEAIPRARSVPTNFSIDSGGIGVTKRDRLLFHLSSGDHTPSPPPPPPVEWSIWYLKKKKATNVFTGNSMLDMEPCWKWILQIKEGQVVWVLLKGIEPNGNDERNADGGIWSAQGIPREKRKRVWEEMFDAWVGGRLKDNTQNTICGVSFLVRPDGDCVQLWVDGGKHFAEQKETADEQLARLRHPDTPTMLKEVLFPDDDSPYTKFTYKSHQEIREAAQGCPSDGEMTSTTNTTSTFTKMGDTMTTVGSSTTTQGWGQEAAQSQPNPINPIAGMQMPLLHGMLPLTGMPGVMPMMMGGQLGQMMMGQYGMPGMLPGAMPGSTDPSAPGAPGMSLPWGMSAPSLPIISGMNGEMTFGGMASTVIDADADSGDEGGPSTGQILRQQHDDGMHAMMGQEVSRKPQQTMTYTTESERRFKMMRAIRKKIRFIHYHLERRKQGKILSPAEITKVMALPEFERRLAELEEEDRQARLLEGGDEGGQPNGGTSQAAPPSAPSMSVPTSSAAPAPSTSPMAPGTSQASASITPQSLQQLQQLQMQQMQQMGQMGQMGHFPQPQQHRQPQPKHHKQPKQRPMQTTPQQFQQLQQQLAQIEAKQKELDEKKQYIGMLMSSQLAASNLSPHQQQQQQQQQLQQLQQLQQQQQQLQQPYPFNPFPFQPSPNNPQKPSFFDATNLGATSQAHTKGRRGGPRHGGHRVGAL